MRPKLDGEGNLLRDAMRVAVPVEDPEKVAARREALLDVIERQVALSPERLKQAESRRKWVQGLRWSAAAAALVLAVGAGMFVQSQHRNPDDARLEGKSAAPHEPESMARVAHQGESLATSQGEKQRLKLPGDTVVTVGERSGLRLIEAVPARQVMELDYGRVDVDVSPAEGEHSRYVSVRTPHAVVEVKGTIFSVDVHGTSAQKPGEASALLTNQQRLETTVSVQRGVVVVHSVAGDLTLLSGDSWSSAERLGKATKSTSSRSSGVSASFGVSAASGTEVGQRAGSESGPSAAAVVPSAGPASPVDIQTTPSSTLAEENELLERAIAASEAGNHRRALLLCDQFLETYPRSPLRATVLAKRAQLKSLQR